MTESPAQVYLFPTTHAQKAIWFIDQMNEGSAAYSIPFSYRIQGDFKPELIAPAINHVINSHETFRTQFGEIDNEVKQIVFPHYEMQVQINDFTDLGEEAAFAKAEAEIQVLSKQPFDLKKLPLICSQVFCLSKTEYLLFINVHHIIVDHLSVLQFANEFSSFYDRLSKKEKIYEDKAALHFGDYAVWQQQYQTDDYFDKKMDYWKEKILDADSYLELPSNKSRPVIQTSNGCEHWFDLSSEASSMIRTFSKKENVSIYIATLSAYATLMHRYSGDEAITLGSPFANRGDQADLEKVMGCFINTLPVVVDFSDDPDFLTVVQRTRSAILEAFNFQDVPFEKIVKAVKPKRQSSYGPIIQQCFMLQDPPMELRLPGLHCENLHVNSLTAKFDILVWLWESETISGLMEYNTDVFDEETIDSLVRNFDVLLVDVCEKPTRPVSQCSLVSAEDEALLKKVNATEISRDFQAITDIGDEHSKKNPLIISYRDLDNEISYQVLQKRSNQLANYLIAQGVKPGDYIGLSVSRGIELVVGVVAILKTGSAYVPLDPDYPRERLTYMISHSGIRLIITESMLRDDLPFENVSLIAVDDSATDISKFSINNPKVTVDPESVAYVIYTSGSTGLPKGVMVPHRAMLNFLAGMTERLRVDSSDKFLALTTLSFDISVLEFFLPLYLGATCLVIDKDVSTDADWLSEIINENDISVMQATPATWRLLVTVDWPGKEDLKALCGGEALPQDLAEQLLLKVKQLWNMYGPTETTVWSTCSLVADPKNVNIGTPIENTKIFVVDKQFQLQPTGVAGELLIGGDGVSLGYLNRDELTEKQFVRIPHLSNSLLYRTGDKVSLSHEGVLRYYNRLDNQVKIRGYRIELGDIENCLLSADAIQKGAVVAKERNGEKDLAAFFVLKPGKSIETSVLRSYLGDKLPKYMVPQYFVELDELPLTPAGKIDRKKLVNDYEINAHSGEILEEEKPRNDGERYLAKLWSETLQLEHIGIHDNFFDIGGHSLLSVQVTARIKKELKVKISARDLVVYSLSQLVNRHQLHGIDQEQTADQHVDEAGNKDEGAEKKASGFLKKFFSR